VQAHLLQPVPQDLDGLVGMPCFVGCSVVPTCGTTQLVCLHSTAQHEPAQQVHKAAAML